MKLPRAVGLLAWGLAVSGSAAAQDWIPFETIDQSALPIVRVSLNGISGQRLLLDFGFEDMLLDSLLVDGAGLELGSRNESQTIDFYGQKENVPVRYVQSLVVGRAEFQSVRTLLVDGDDATSVGGIRSYGRTGRAIFEPLRVTIHYPRQLLLLEESPADEVPDGSVSFRTDDRFMLVSIRVLGTGGELATGEEALFIVDPGTSNSVLDKRWADKAKLPTSDSGSHAIAPTIEIGGFQQEEMPFLLGEMRELPYQLDAVGVLGADLLAELSLTYDFARDLVWFTQVEKGPS